MWESFTEEGKIWAAFKAGTRELGVGKTVGEESGDRTMRMGTLLPGGLSLLLVESREWEKEVETGLITRTEVREQLQSEYKYFWEPRRWRGPAQPTPANLACYTLNAILEIMGFFHLLTQDEFESDQFNRGDQEKE